MKWNYFDYLKGFDRYIYVLLTLIWMNFASGQNTFSKSWLLSESLTIDIIQFEVSANDRLWVLDESGELFYLIGNEYRSYNSDRQFTSFHLSNESIVAIATDSIFFIKDDEYIPKTSSTIHNPTSSRILFCNHEFFITSTGKYSFDSKDSTLFLEKMNYAYEYGDQILTANKDGIYLLGNTLRKYQIPDCPVEPPYSSVYSRNKNIIVNTALKSILFSARTYNVKTIKAEGQTVKINNSGDVWSLSEGNLYYQSRPFISDVDIQVHQITYDGQSANWSTAFLENKPLSFDLFVRGIEHTNLLDLAYWDKDQWKPIQNHTFSITPKSGKLIPKLKLSDGTKTRYFELPSLLISDDDSKLNNQILLIIVVLFLLLIVVVLLHYRRKLGLHKITNEVNEIRSNKLIKDVEEKLSLLQVNPHFLFNTLNSIQGLVILNRPFDAKKSIRIFSKLMRQVLNYGDKGSISFKEDAEFLTGYLELESINRSSRLNYEVTLASKDEKCIIPPMLTQILVENAIKHGLTSNDAEGLIRIKYFSNNSNYGVVVKDNGSTNITSKKHNYKSKGLILVSERLKRFHPDANLISESIIDDSGHKVGYKSIIEIPFI